MDTTSIKKLTIPEGEAIKLKIDGTTVWRDSDYYDVDNEVVYSKSVPSYSEKDSVLRVGGRSVVFNQLSQGGKGIEAFGVTAITDSNGLTTLTGTCTNNYSNCMYHVNNIIQGDIFLVSLTDIVNPNNINFECALLNQHYLSSSPSSPFAIYPAVRTNNSAVGITLNTTDVDVSGISFKFQCFNLTKLFGAGNEATALGVANFDTTANKNTAIANFKAMFPESYYAYNTGEVKSACVSQVEVKDDDGVVTSTATIPSSIQALDGYGESNGSTNNYVDYENKKYHYFGKYVSGVWTPSATGEVITDISSLLTSGFLQDINVEVGGSLTFKNTLGDSYRLPVPVRNEFKLGIHTYSQLANAVAGGARSELIGLEIPDTWRDTAGTSYDDPAIVVDVRQVEDANGVSHWSAICQRKWSSKDAIQFDAAEQVLATGVYESGLYYYTISGTTATLLVAGTDYNVGDTITGTVYKNSIRDTSGYILLYGYNRYRYSACRQYLNSNSTVNGWWTPAHVGDVAPSQLNSVRGYKAGCSSELLNAVKPIKISCVTNNTTDGGVTDTLCDEFWIPSGIEMYGIYNSGDGTYFPYWKTKTGLDSPSNAANSGRAFRNISSGSGSICSLRSAVTYYSHTMYRLNYTGEIGQSRSSEAYTCTPCFAIYK